MTHFGQLKSSKPQDRDQIATEPVLASRQSKSRLPSPLNSRSDIRPVAGHRAKATGLRNLPTIHQPDRHRPGIGITPGNVAEAVAIEVVGAGRPARWQVPNLVADILGEPQRAIRRYFSHPHAQY
jgi:hypothetical protein